MTAEEAQQLLEISPPFTSADLKDAHKRSLVSWFPAQFMGDRSRLLEALDHTNRLHQAYDVLLPRCEDSNEWLRRENGEVDVESAPEVPEPPVAAYPAPGDAPRHEAEEPEPYLAEPSAPADPWKNAPIEVPRHSTDPTVGTVPPQIEPAPYKPDVPPPKIAASQTSVTVAPAPLGRSTVVSRSAGSAPADGANLGTGSSQEEASGPQTGGNSAGRDPAWMKPTWRTEIIHATKPTSHKETAEAPSKAEDEPWTRGWLAETESDTDLPSHLPPIPAPVHDLLTNSAAAGPLSTKRGDTSEAPKAAAPVTSEIPAPVAGAGASAETAGAPPRRPKVVISPRLKAASGSPDTTSSTQAPAPGSSFLATQVQATPTAPVPTVVPSAKVETQPVPEPVPAPPHAPAPQLPPAELAPLPKAASSAPPATANPPTQRSGSMLMQAVLNSGKTIAPAKSESKAAPTPPSPSPPPSKAAAPIPAPAPEHGPGPSRFSVYEEEDDQDMSSGNDHSLVSAMGDRYHPAEMENPSSPETTRHLPARPLAPSRGPKPAKEKKRAAVREEPRSRPMAPGAALLRFFLVALVIGGFVGGVYWASKLESVKDPFGLENGVGARVLQQGFDSLRQNAEQGDKNAQYKLARIYQAGGKGVPRNPEEAVNWLRKAAEQGHIDAQRAMGDAYKDGIGVPKDNGEAVKWYNRAREQE